VPILATVTPSRRTVARRVSYWQRPGLTSGLVVCMQIRTIQTVLGSIQIAVIKLRIYQIHYRQWRYLKFVPVLN
jgi:hypothetical protein